MAVMQASEANINFVKTRLASPDGKLWGKAPGMVLVKPTSIAYSGTSATLGENGQVTFSAVTSLSLNGVFTADFDNYVISLRCSPTGGVNDLVRLRSSGVDATGTDYIYQYLLANGTTIGRARSSALGYWIGGNMSNTVAQNGRTMMLYGPFLTQPTAIRTNEGDSFNSATIYDVAGTHSLSSSYDGFTMSYGGGVTATGAVQVYGVRS